MTSSTPDNLMPVGSLWIGERLSWMERASIQSFLDLGHDYCLYAYGPVENMPENAVLGDAREIWDTNDIAIYKQANSPALHADIFRVKMVLQTGRVWVDTDVIALRPFTRDLEWFIGHERQDRLELGNAVMGMPSDSKTLETLHEFLTGTNPIPPWWNEGKRQRFLQDAANGNPSDMGDMPWGTAGPQALTFFASQSGEIEKAQEQNIFFPVTFQDRKALVEGKYTEVLNQRMNASQSLSVHLYSRWMRKFCSRNPSGYPPRDSWIGSWLEKKGYVDYDALNAGENAGDEPTPPPAAAEAAPVIETTTPENAPTEAAAEGSSPSKAEAPTDPKAKAPELVYTPEQEREYLEELDERKKLIPGGGNASKHGRVTIVTMAKDEGPYILEWVAYHHLLGFTDILVYTNDCTDGTDEILDALAAQGLVTRTDNIAWRNKPPQSRALHWAEYNPLKKASDWILVMDFDEFVVIKTPQGDVDSLIDAIELQGATGISLAWRFFGSNDLVQFEPGPVTERMTRAAPNNFSKGFGLKTFYKADPEFVMAIHRPYLNQKFARSPEGQNHPVNWLDSDGQMIDGKNVRWKFSQPRIDYTLVQLNHYGVKSHEEYLLRRMRGDVLDNHSKYDAQYFGIFDRNEVEDEAALAHVPRVKEYVEKLLKIDSIRAAADLVERHRQEKLTRIRQAKGYADQMAELETYQLDQAFATKRKK